MNLISVVSTDIFVYSQIACQPSTVLVKNHFVQIFSVCMALHCSKRLDSDKGALVLQSSILHLSEISENERDKLIKRHMVCLCFKDKTCGPSVVEGILLQGSNQFLFSSLCGLNNFL